MPWTSCEGMYYAQDGQTKLGGARGPGRSWWGWSIPWRSRGYAQAFFPHEAEGSMIVQDGTIVGSELIGQPFSDPAYFWSRPSATTPDPLQRGGLLGLQPGSHQPRAPGRCGGTHPGAARAPTRATTDPCRSTWSRLRPVASIRTSARRPRSTRWSVWLRARGLTAEEVRALVAEAHRRTAVGRPGRAARERP